MVHPQNAKDSPLQVVLKGQEVKINQVDSHISIKMVNQAEGKLGLSISVIKVGDISLFRKERRGS